MWKDREEGKKIEEGELKDTKQAYRDFLNYDTYYQQKTEIGLHQNNTNEKMKFYIMQSFQNNKIALQDR